MRSAKTALVIAVVVGLRPIEGASGCSRAENKARQRSTIIRNVSKNTPVFTTRQDKAEVERRAAAKSVRRSLPEDPDIAVSLVVEMESKREEATKRRCEAELAEAR